MPQAVPRPEKCPSPWKALPDDYFPCSCCFGLNLQYPHRYIDRYSGGRIQKCLAIHGLRQPQGRRAMRLTVSKSDQDRRRCTWLAGRSVQGSGSCPQRPANRGSRTCPKGFGLALPGLSVDVGMLVGPATAGGGHGLVDVVFFMLVRADVRRITECPCDETRRHCLSAIRYG